MNTFLVTSETNETYQNHGADAKIWALAVKLSSLNDNGLSIIDILDRSIVRVIIDAEDSRLDEWIKNQIISHNLSKTQLDRIFITVQARRSDAESQLLALDKLGVQVVLVAGHQSYHQNIQEHVSNKMIRLLKSYSNIQIIGANGKRLKKLKIELGIKSAEFEWLELFGLHSNGEHKERHLLWTYLALDSQIMGLSQEGSGYLKRRKDGVENKENYIVTSYQQLHTLSANFGIVVYFDILSKSHFYAKLSQIKQ